MKAEERVKSAIFERQRGAVTVHLHHSLVAELYEGLGKSQRQRTKPSTETADKN
jgi:hypothetical protein